MRLDSGHPLCLCFADVIFVVGDWCVILGSELFSRFASCCLGAAKFSKKGVRVLIFDTIPSMPAIYSISLLYPLSEMRFGAMQL